MIKAGFAEKVITPPIPTYLAGYFHERIGESVRDDLYAKAAVLAKASVTTCTRRPPCLKQTVSG